MRRIESGKSGSVGATGGQLPVATRLLLDTGTKQNANWIGYEFVATSQPLIRNDCGQPLNRRGMLKHAGTVAKAVPILAAKGAHPHVP